MLINLVYPNIKVRLFVNNLYSVSVSVVNWGVALASETLASKLRSD